MTRYFLRPSGYASASIEQALDSFERGGITTHAPTFYSLPSVPVCALLELSEAEAKMYECARLSTLVIRQEPKL